MEIVGHLFVTLHTRFKSVDKFPVNGLIHFCRTTFVHFAPINFCDLSNSLN